MSPRPVNAFVHLLIYVLLNAFATVVSLSILFNAEVDIGQEELNLWYEHYRSGSISVFGSNFFWINLLNFLSLLPVVSTWDAICIITLSKTLQYLILTVSILINKKSASWIYLLFLPNAFYFGMSLGRSSLDWAFVFLLCAAACNRNLLVHAVGITTLFHKALLLVLYFFSVLAERINNNKVTIAVLVMLLIPFFGSEIINFTNSSLSIGAYGNYGLMEGSFLNVSMMI